MNSPNLARLGLLAAFAALGGCYDLRGGGVADAAGREVTVMDVVQPNDVPTTDMAPAEDVVDARSSLDADAMDVSENDVTPDVVDATTVPDVTDAPPSVDAVDVPIDDGPPPCPMGLTRCGDVCVDIATTPAHCGMCGMACPTRANAVPACVAGTCRSVCNLGFADCDNAPSTGCEARLDTDTTCGSCGTRCEGATPLCQDAMGAYRCVSGCSGAAGTRCGMSCVDTQSDLQHCGMCDNACPVPTNGRATCAAATCGIACNTGYHVCGTSCADDRAVETCGALCSPCPARANATTTCNAGSCGFTCNAGFGDCDDNANNGCESVLGSTLAHCGRCGNACPTRDNATNTCTMGVCGSSCNAGFADCDGNASNGCEASLAGSGYSCSTCAAGAWCGTTRSCSVERCSPVQSWVRFGGSMAPACAAITAVGTVVSAGTFRNPTDFGGGTVTPRGFDVYVVAHNRDGSTRWHRTFGGVGNDDISRVALDAEGNIYACGSFTGAVDFGDGNTLTSASGSQDAFVLSLSPAGVLRWVRALGGTGREVSQGIAVSASGRVAVSGVTESQTFSPPATVGPTGTAGGQDGFVVTFDQSGTHQWTRIFGGTGEDGAYGVGVGALGETAVSAQVASSVTLNGTVTTGDTDAALIVFEATGSVRWAQRFATPGVNYGRNVAIDARGNIAFLLESEAASMGILGTPLSAPGHVVASFTSAGVRRWAQSIIGAGVGGAGFALSTDARGDVLWSHHAQAAALVVGSDLLALGSGQAIIAFTDLGTPRWARRIDGDSPWCVASRSGVVAMGGSSGIAAFDASAICPMGVCILSCDPGLADCDGDVTNGCEVDTRTSVTHCGTCGRACATPANGRATCVAGSCGTACDAGFADCDGNTANGCEANLSAATSCGACGTVCSPSQRCERGVCAPCSALAPMTGGYAEVFDDRPLRLASGSFTVEAWLYAREYPNRCQHAIATKRGTSILSGWFFSVTGINCSVTPERLFFQVSGADDPSVIANTSAPVGRWFHAAATFNQATGGLSLWQDGVQVGAAVVSPPNASSAASLYIGNDSSGSSYVWPGYIDDLRISSGIRYTGPFTAASQLSSDASVIALWRFQESTGVAIDASPNGYSARLVMADRVVAPAICRP